MLQARAGRLQPAIAALRAMLAAGEDDGLVAMDLSVLLQQARRPGEAIAVFEQAAVADPPDYALLAVARAYRDARRYRDAEKLAREGLNRFPDQTEWPLLLALVLTDAGRPKEALEVLSGPEAQRAPPVERRLAEGYAWRKAGDPYKALSAYTDALKLVPANKEARTTAAALLKEQGGPYGAAALAGTTRPYATDQAAAMVRWGTDTPTFRPGATNSTAPTPRSQGWKGCWPHCPCHPPSVVACGSTASWRFGIACAWKRPPGKGEPCARAAHCRHLPRKPMPMRCSTCGGRKKRASAYRRVLAGNPKGVPAETRTLARYGLFNAAVELEDFDTAYATIDALVDDDADLADIPR